MNKIFNYFIPSSTTNPNSYEIPNLKLSGSLYIKEIGKKLEKITEECTISLIILNENKFEYLLNIVNDEYEEGDDGNWSNMQIKITNEGHFKFFINSMGNDCLMWQKNLDFFIFELFRDPDIINKKEKFFDKLSELICSNDFQIDLKTAENEETKSQYIMHYDVITDIEKFLEDNYKEFRENKDVDNLISQMSNVQISLIKFKNLFPKATEKFSGTGNLFKYNKETGNSDLFFENGLFKIYNVDIFKYYIVCEHDNNVLVYTQITQNANVIVFDKEKNIMFCDVKGEKGKETVNAYSFSFQNVDIEKLKSIIHKSQYETSTLTPYEDLSEDNKIFFEKENILNETASFAKSYDIDFGDGYEKEDKINNKFTTQAYLYDRTFVAKDNNTIEVFKPSNESGELLSVMNLPSVNEYKGNKINLSDAKMFKSDTNMLFLDKNNNKSLFQFDVEKGKIVEEWETNYEIKDFTHEKKFSQMENSNIINCINQKNILILDSRQKNKLANVKQYQTNPKFNCMASTNFGGVAIGSLNGEIRLYDDLKLKAKTLLTTYGDAIRAIDVTKDGKYILATCDKYLMVINTVNPENGNNGFEKRLGKFKHGPKTLKITPFDISKYNLQSDNFTPAKFNISKNEDESNITTSIGEYIVIWNFNKIKKGILDQYKIKKVNQFVIGNTFKYNKNQVIVTMPNTLRVQNQKFSEY